MASTRLGDAPRIENTGSTSWKPLRYSLGHALDDDESSAKNAPKLFIFTPKTSENFLGRRHSPLPKPLLPWGGINTQALHTPTIRCPLHPDPVYGIDPIILKDLDNIMK